MTSQPASDTEITRRRNRWRSAPVFWAAFGAACVLFQLYIFAVWALGGNAHALPASRAPSDPARQILTRAVELVVLIGIVIMALVCWSRSRARHRVSLSAALMTGYALTFWTSPYNSAVHHAAGHNRYDFNVVSWGPQLPGWHGPTPQIETFLMAGGYAWVILWVWIALGIATGLRRRTSWSRPRVIALTALASMIFDLAFEFGYILVGGYAYPLALPHLTFFEGHWYQLPITSALCMVTFATLPVVAMTVYARDGQEVWLLEGTSALPQRIRPWVRLLAGSGYANAGMLALQIVTLTTSLFSRPVTVGDWIYRPPN